MQLTKLRAAPVLRAEVPPCAPAAGTDGGTASQLIRSVRRTCSNAKGIGGRRVTRPSTAALAAALLLAGLVAACTRQASRRGGGVTEQGVASLRHGMTVEQVASILGPPLFSHHDAPPGSGKRSSTYAQHGGWKVLGSHGTVFGERGLDLILSFQDERLAEALLINQHGEAVCACVPEHCEADWASSCLVAVRW